MSGIINTDMQRLDYTQSQDQLFKSDVVDASPFEQFQKWFKSALACNIPEPYAMVISTIDAKQKPHSRVVLMREFNAEGLIFYTNYQSLKGQNLAHNPYVCVLFFWQHLEQQIRIEGAAERLSSQQNQAYFSKRPRGSQISAIASPQSQPIQKNELINHTLKIEAQYQNAENIPCPKNWGGYLIRPQYFEFWQGGSSRLHDRITYTQIHEDGTEQKNLNKWLIQRVAP